jgi:hypothetical protein
MRAQAIEYLPTKNEALGSNLSATKKERQEKEINELLHR